MPNTLCFARIATAALFEQFIRRRIMAKGLSLHALIVAFFSIFSMSAALADATIPTKDIEGASDSAILKRYDGSWIISYENLGYSEFNVPLTPLKRSDIEDERDQNNNRVYVAEKTEELEGNLVRLVYLAPENRSPLEVLRNYEEEITGAGGTVEFECKRDKCGGDPIRAASGGGGDMSLMQYFFDESSIKDADFSNGKCALTQSIDNQHFMAAKLSGSDDAAWVTVQTYQFVNSIYCDALNGRTIAVVHVLEKKPREQKMVKVDAAAMARSIEKDGSISLYGIYFDTNKAELKPESAPTLQEIAALLQDAKDLTVLVVGHTDNQGSVDYNLDLSQKRAKSVRDALVNTHGISAERLLSTGAGLSAPVASNRTDEGRALNRRVALVELNAKK
jgi:OOP family OmpA-OmpF porin